MMMKIKKWIVALLCLVLLRTMCNALAEAPAGAPAVEAPFTKISEADSSVSRTYYSDNYYIVLTQKDGTWWRVDAQTDDRYSELYNALSESENFQDSYNTFMDYVHSLPVAYAEALSENPIEGAEMKAYAAKNLKALLADGFEISWIEACTADETEASGTAKPLILANSDGKDYRVPLYIMNSGLTGNFFILMDKGLYNYQFTYRGTVDSLRKAAEDGSWAELVPEDALFNGFSRSTIDSFEDTASNSRRTVTEEEALAIRTIRDATDRDYIAFTANADKNYVLLLRGEDCLWTATAVLDDRYPELRAAADASSEENDALWEYLKSLPVTVEKIEGDYPRPIEDMSVFTGKTVRELLAEGFMLSFYTVSTQEESGKELNKPLLLKNSDGSEFTTLNGNVLALSYNEFIIFSADKDLYEYNFEFEGNAGTLAAAAEDGSFLELTVKEAYFCGFSGTAPAQLGLDQ